VLKSPRIVRISKLMKKQLTKKDQILTVSKILARLKEKLQLARIKEKLPLARIKENKVQEAKEIVLAVKPGM